MRTIELLLASPDQEYVERFMRSVRSTVHEYDWLVKSVTNLDLLFQSLHSEKRYDLNVIDTLWLQELSSISEQDPSIRLTEKFIWLDGKGRREIEWKGISRLVVAKYQAVPNLLSSFLAVRSLVESDDLDIQGKRDCCVIGIYSSIAGSGKTTLSFHMIKLLRQLNKRPLYVNLELIHAGEIFWDGLDEDRFGQLLYYIKSGSEQMKEKLDQTICHDPSLQCDVIPPIKHFNNRMDMGFEDVGKLIDMLREQRSYDYIILDLDSLMHDSIQGALHFCDTFYWLINDESSCWHKTKTILSILERSEQLSKSKLIEKGAWIINRSIGNVTHERHPHDLPIAGSLPAIPEWSRVKTKEEMIHSEYFTQCLSKFFPPAAVG